MPPMQTTHSRRYHTGPTQAALTLHGNEQVAGVVPVWCRPGWLRAVAAAVADLRRADGPNAQSENATSVQWVIRRAVEQRNGRVICHSKEGASVLGDRIWRLRIRS